MRDLPDPPTLNDIEQDIVRMAADWLEHADETDDEAAYHRVAGLLLIIDRLFPHGAVRLDQAPVTG